MSWPRDDTKLERVRALMADEDVDALVVRAPDNVLYLSNFLPMKGYDAVVFPREGNPTLICLEPSLEDARRMAWTDDVRLFKGYDERDPRPPAARALDLALAVCRERGLERIGLGLHVVAKSARIWRNRAHRSRVPSVAEGGGLKPHPWVGVWGNARAHRAASLAPAEVTRTPAGAARCVSSEPSSA